MKDFLLLNDISEEGAEIYLESLKRGTPLTKFELKTIRPEIDEDLFSKSIENLVEKKLFLKIDPKSPNELLSYLALPPVFLILRFYSNINSGLSQIGEQVQNIITSNIENIFQEDNKLELDSLYQDFSDALQDYEEIKIIQKQDVKDTIKELDKLMEINIIISNSNEIIKELHEKVKSISQVQFAKLIKVITKIKTKIQERIEAIEFKKNEDLKVQLIELVGDVFKEELQQMVDDFTDTLYSLIEEEFDEIIPVFNEKIVDPINSIIDTSYQNVDEFNELYGNMIKNFDTKITLIKEAIEESKSKFEENIGNLKDHINSEISPVILDSLKQINALNNPIVNALRSYFETVYRAKRTQTRNIRFIESFTKLNEEIFTIMSHATDQIIFIFPKIENHLNQQQIDNLKSEVRLKIAASDPFTNSFVKFTNEKNNVDYRKLENDSTFLLLGDRNHIVMGYIKPDQNAGPLDNCVGFGTMDPKLISLLAPAINHLWSTAAPERSSSTFAPRAGKAERPQLKPAPASQSSNVPQTTPRRAVQLKPAPVNQPEVSETLEKAPDVEKPSETEETKLESIPNQTEKSQPQTSSPSPEKASQTISASGFVSQIKPSDDNPADVEINAAFNLLLNDLNDLKSNEFSSRLQDVADLILEKKGFSVLLSNIRQWITSYKRKDILLDDREKNEIFMAVESWKKRIFV